MLSGSARRLLNSPTPCAPRSNRTKAADAVFTVGLLLGPNLGIASRIPCLNPCWHRLLRFSLPRINIVVEFCRAIHPRPILETQRTALHPHESSAQDPDEPERGCLTIARGREVSNGLRSKARDMGHAFVACARAPQPVGAAR